MTRRVAMIGLDNASASLVDRYATDGTMPNLARLLSEGRRVELTMPDGFVAESCWPEFATGRSHPETNYWTMMEFDPETYVSWYGRTPQASYFWARPDLTSIVFDVPETGVSEDIRGLHVVGWGSHAQGHPIASQPRDLVSRIDREFGVHPMVLSDSHNAFHSPVYLANLADAMVEGIRLRPKISRWLMEQRPDWDLFITVFGETHVLGHQFLHAIDPDHPLHGVVDTESALEDVRRVLGELDAAVADLAASFDDDVQVMVFVTHGMRPNAIDTVGATLIPELLHRAQFGQGLIDLPDWRPGTPPIVPDADVLPRHWLESRMREPAPSTAKGLRQVKKVVGHRVRHALSPRGLARLEKLVWRRPDWWTMRIRPAVPPETRDILTAGARRQSEQMVPTTWYRPYWPQMRYFVVPSFSDCHLRVNLRGRERDGLVEPADYDSVLDEITETLRALVDARTGRPVVDRIIRVRENPMTEPGPPCDLVVTMSDVVTDAVEHPTLGALGPVPFHRMGEHDGRGWFVMSSDVGVSSAAQSMRPRDLASTVVDMLGIAPDPRLTGRSALADSK